MNSFEKKIGIIMAVLFVFVIAGWIYTINVVSSEIKTKGLKGIVHEIWEGE